ncbi:MAG: GNAT family N-acetyltransferase [Lachnospiraceae bacterium]|nr:GNAT family N-acetyltransferase [Lachnospiraceae bacterium]
MMEGIIIRSATLEDAGDIQKIYSYYVENTAISFEYTAPDVDEIKRRIEETLKDYPYLVAVSDGRVVGYAYAGRFHTRAAFLYSAELSIYIDKEWRGNGLGKELYNKIESILSEKKIKRVYASIAASDENDCFVTDASLRFHIAMGYKQVARFHKCGFKFGNWYDLIYVEKNL